MRALGCERIAVAVPLGAQEEQMQSRRAPAGLKRFYSGQAKVTTNKICFALFSFLLSCRADGHGNGWVLGSRKLPFFLSFICPGVSLQLAAYVLAACVSRWPVACASAMQCLQLVHEIDRNREMQHKTGFVIMH